MQIQDDSKLIFHLVYQNKIQDKSNSYFQDQSNVLHLFQLQSKFFVEWAQKYGGRYRYRDDDGGSVMTNPLGMVYDPTYDCLVITSWVAAEYICPNGLPANTMPVMAHDDDDDVEILTDELIVATSMAVLGGATSMFTIVYIITQLNQAKADIGVAAVPSVM